MHFSKYLDQKLKKKYFKNFNPFFRPTRVYHGNDISFDKTMDFSLHIIFFLNFELLTKRLITFEQKR